MTIQDVDEFVIEVLKKYGVLMRPAISRYIRREFIVDVNSSVLEARLSSLVRRGVVSSSMRAMVSGYYFQLKQSIRPKG